MLPRPETTNDSVIIARMQDVSPEKPVEVAPVIDAPQEKVIEQNLWRKIVQAMQAIKP